MFNIISEAVLVVYCWCLQTLKLETISAWTPGEIDKAGGMDICSFGLSEKGEMKVREIVLWMIRGQRKVFEFQQKISYDAKITSNHPFLALNNLSAFM